MKKLMVLLTFLFLVYYTYSQQETEVKGLRIKFLIIDLCDEIYQTNVENMDVFTQQNYQKMNCSEHFNWMKDVYNKMPKSKKDDLKKIRESIHPYNLMSLTAKLNDTVDFETIINTIALASDKKKLNKMYKDFYSFMYKKYIKDYLLQNVPTFELKARKINEEIKLSSFDILDFIENQSGLYFKNRRKISYYFTMRPIGAYGFDTENEKISTIQTSVDNYNRILSTPFHEFSHELFQQFTRDSLFINAAELMKTDTLFTSKWKTIGSHSYDWIGWCEENLVEGFSKYLEYRKFGVYKKNISYLYDSRFCEYLIEINFNPKEISLEKCCLDFYSKLN